MELARRCSSASIDSFLKAQRRGTASKVAAPIIFLCSEQAGFIDRGN
ncbi:hypothetical protein [Falsirhodobacter deserti]|nr:hypothetical protein [Falsirhodobacter deserti]